MPTPADGMARRVQVEALTKADVASAVELAVRVLQVKPGDRGEQFRTSPMIGARCSSPRPMAK
jgi:hypothetical protein